MKPHSSTQFSRLLCVLSLLSLFLQLPRDAAAQNAQPPCAPATVERSDYFLDFTTSNMPDPKLNDRPAQLEVHRVTPVFAAGCPDTSPVTAVVLVHGQTVPGTVVFDLQYKDYSLMESLARRGIDTFAVNHLGFASSTILDDDPLDNPHNASLPQCVGEVALCSPVRGVCDCNVGLAATYKMDQQGKTDYLNPNPLKKPHKHTSNIHFQNVDHQVEQLDLVVNDVLAKTGLGKIFLLSISLGGSTIGKYLAVDAEPETGQLSHQDKVAGAIFLASTFRGAGASATWPLGLINRADAMAAFRNNNPDSSCPGRQDAGIGDALWTAVQSHDPIGLRWGPAGLSRFPVVPRFGWVDSAATKIAIPALIINGLNDGVVPVARSVQLWNSSPEQKSVVDWRSGAQCDPGYALKPWPPESDPVLPTRCRLDNRILMQLDCTTHALLWETCSGDGCVDPHTTVQKRVGDWILTGK